MSYLENIKSFLQAIDLNMAIIILFIGIILIITKRGIHIDFKNKIFSFSSNHYDEIRCKFCDDYVTTIVDNVAKLSFAKSEEKDTVDQKLKDILLCQMEIIENRITEFFNEILNDQMTKKNIVDNNERLKKIKINLQILQLVWIIKKHEVFNLIKSSLVQNHFSTLNASELRTFANKRLELFMSKLEQSRIFPELSEDENIIINREEFLIYLKERMVPLFKDALQDMYFQAQVIRKNSEERIQLIEKEINSSQQHFKEKRENIKKELKKL